MLLTYQGVLRSNQVHWLTDGPTHLTPDQSVRVIVTLLEPQPPVSSLEQGHRMAAALAKLAALPANEELSDPVEWQREAREDRPLPDREG